MKLTEATEEVATFYGKMLDHDYTTKEAFRKVMTEKEKDVIRYGVLTFYILPESDDGKGERCDQVWCLDLLHFYV